MRYIKQVDSDDQFEMTNYPTIQLNRMNKNLYLCSGKEVPSNQIWYTTTDGEKIDIESALEIKKNDFYEDGEVITNLKNHFYYDGKYILEFDSPLTDTCGLFDPSYFNEEDEDWYYLDTYDTLDTVIFPDSLTYISSYTLSSTSIRNVKFPKNLQSIGEGAFMECGLLEELIFPPSLTYVGYSAFSNLYAVYDDCHLRNVIFEGDSLTFDEAAFEDLNAEIDNLIIKVREVSFISSGNFTRATINNFTLETDTWDFKYGAFKYSNINITEIEFPENTKLPSYSIGNNPFRNLKKATITCSENVDSDLIVGLPETLEEIIIKPGTNTTSPNLNTLTGLREVTLPDNLTKIASLSGTQITSITIPDSVIESCFNSKTFSDCINLTNIYYKGKVNDLSSRNISPYMFQESGIKEITINTPNSYSFKDCTSLEKVIIRDVTRSWKVVQPFAGCENLKHFELHHSSCWNVFTASYFGSDALEAIETLVLGDDEDALAKTSFPSTTTSALTGLKELYLPSGLTYIPSNSFELNTELRVIHYSGSAPGFPWGAPNPNIIKLTE